MTKTARLSEIDKAIEDARKASGSSPPVPPRARRSELSLPPPIRQNGR